MAWISLAASEELPEHWRATLPPSHTAKTTDTLKLCCCREWQHETYREPQSGMTLGHSGAKCCPGLRSSTAASPARTFPLPAAEQAWKESAAAFSSRSPGSLASYDRASSSWKTFQLSLDGVETLSSELWPTSGMTVDGTCYPLQMWERITSENDGGSWPTPRAEDSQCAGAHRGIPDTLHSAVKMWPTPKGSPSGPDLAVEGRGKAANLETAVAKSMWPTPRASEWKGTGPLGSKSQQYRLEKGYLDATVQERGQVTGQLNPTWVEWLMGYPSGWTVCADWAMPSSRPKRGKPSSG